MCEGVGEVSAILGAGAVVEGGGAVKPPGRGVRLQARSGKIKSAAQNSAAESHAFLGEGCASGVSTTAAFFTGEHGRRHARTESSKPCARALLAGTLEERRRGRSIPAASRGPSPKGSAGV